VKPLKIRDFLFVKYDLTYKASFFKEIGNKKTLLVRDYYTKCVLIDSPKAFISKDIAVTTKKIEDNVYIFIVTCISLGFNPISICLGACTRRAIIYQLEKSRCCYVNIIIELLFDEPSSWIYYVNVEDIKYIFSGGC
jgi:hypothetical protein